MVDRISSESGTSADADVVDDAPPEVITGDMPPDSAEEVPLDEPEPDAEPLAAAPEPPPEEIDFAAEIKPDKVSADGKTYFTTKSKWDRLQASDKTVQALRELDPGITVDSIKEMHSRVLALDELLTDYHSGDAAKVSGVADVFVGVGTDGRPNKNPASVAAFVDHAVARAAQHYPTAFKVIEKKMLTGLAQRQYAKYQQTKDEADKHLAWNLDWMARGDYRRDIDQAPGQQVDPVAAERAALQRERQSYEFRIQQDRQARITQAVNTAEADAKSAVDQAVETALSVIPANVREKKAIEYKHAVRDLHEKFEEGAKANANYTQSRNVMLSQLRANPTPEARSAYVAFEKRWAEWFIGRAKSEVVSRFSNGVIQQATAANEKHEKLQERREPGGNSGTPVQRATLTQKLRDQSTTYDQGVNLLFEAIKRR